MDVYNKILALKSSGIQVILHCFKYGRDESNVLEEVCEHVYYYKRDSFWKSIFTKRPYIVASRQDPILLNRLANDDFPILFEGLHTCGFLDHPSLEHRRKIARMHNIEWSYYSQLKKRESSLFRRTYFALESFKLKYFESVLSHATAICAISENDHRYFSNYNSNCHIINAFHSYEKIEAQLGTGNFLLYHGNLSVSENQEAVYALLEKVMPYLASFKLIVAGKNPSQELEKTIYATKNVELVRNPSEQRINELIKNAHIHLLPTFQDTGVKLKLLHALFNGRHCLVNNAMVPSLELKSVCIIEDNISSWPLLIEQLQRKPFDELDIEKRKEILYLHYHNLKNAAKLKNILFDDTKNENTVRSY